MFWVFLGKMVRIQMKGRPRRQYSRYCRYINLNMFEWNSKQSLSFHYYYYFGEYIFWALSVEQFGLK